MVDRLRACHRHIVIIAILLIVAGPHGGGSTQAAVGRRAVVESAATLLVEGRHLVVLPQQVDSGHLCVSRRALRSALLRHALFRGALHRGALLRGICAPVRTPLPAVLEGGRLRADVLAAIRNGRGRRRAAAVIGVRVRR